MSGLRERLAEYSAAEWEVCSEGHCGTGIPSGDAETLTREAKRLAAALVEDYTETAGLDLATGALQRAARELADIDGALSAAGMQTGTEITPSPLAERIEAMARERDVANAKNGELFNEVERLRAVTLAAIAHVIAEGPCPDNEYDEGYCEDGTCTYCDLCRTSDAVSNAEAKG